MVFMAFRAIEGTRGENPLIYMIFRRYRYHSAIIISRIQPDIAVERNSRQAKAENSTENRILHWFLKGIFIFAQWFWGPQLVLYKWLWSKLSNYSMIFRPKMHDFGTYLTIVHFEFWTHSNLAGRRFIHQNRTLNPFKPLQKTQTSNHFGQKLAEA